MLKRELLLITLLFGVFNLNAQLKNNFKLGGEAGLLRTSDFEKLGFFLNIEPKLNVSENAYFGLRIGATINSQKFENLEPLQYYIDEAGDNGVISIVPTFDYYFKENRFRPYVGLGVGAYLLAAYIDVFGVVKPSENKFIVNAKNQIGILLRAGVESGRTRFGLEYNFVPKADIEISNGLVIGTVNNSFFGLSIGYTIIGVKNSK